MLTYGTIREATNTASVTSFLEERILAGSEWHLVKVWRRSVRLDPPVSYTALYRVPLSNGEASTQDPPADGEPAEKRERELHLVAKGVFDPADWDEYATRLRNRFGDRPCDPLTGHGHPVY